jgi:hypothetical protein
MSKRAMSSGLGDQIADAGSRFFGAGMRLFAAWRGYDRTLDRAEALIQDGHPERLVPLLAPMRGVVERMWGPCAPACRAASR